MGRPQSIDRDALHSLLARRADRRSSIKLLANELALEIGVSSYHFSRIIAEMQEDGRIRQVSISKHNIRTYMVMDPDTWQAQRQQERQDVIDAKAKFATLKA